MATETIKYAGLKLTVDGAAEFQKSLSEINGNLKQSQAELSKSTAEYGKNSKEIGALTAQQKFLDESLNLNKEKQSALNEIVEEASKQYGENSKEVQALKTKLTEAEAEEIRLQKSLDVVNKELVTQKSGWTQLGTSLTENGKKLQEVGGKISDVGKNLSLKLTAPIIGAGTAAVKFFGDFQEGVNKINTLDMSAPPEKINKIKGEMLALSSKTGIAATDISEATYQMGSALGELGDDVVSYVEVANKAAIGGFTDTSTAVNGLTTVMNTYGLKGSEAMSKISDQMLMAQNLGKTSFGEVASSIGNVVPIANSLNVSTEELFASYATLTKNGIATAQATTGLKAAYSNIIKPSSDASKAAEQLGIDFSAAHLQSVGWAGFLDEIKEKTGGNTETMAKLFGSVEALNTVTVLTSENGMNDLNNALVAMENSTGATDAAFAKMQEGVNKSFSMVLNDLKNTAIQLGDIIAPAIEPIIEKLGEAIKWFGTLDDSVKTTVIVFAGIAAAIGPVVAAIGSVMSVAGELSVAFGVVATKIAAAGGLIPALAGLAPVLLPIVGVIAGVVAAGVLLYQNWDLVKEKAKALYDYLKPTFDTIKKFFNDWGREVSPIFTTAFENIKRLAETIFNGLKDFWENWGSTIKTLFETLFNNVKIIVSTAFEVIKTVVNTVLKNISEAINIFTSVLKGDWQGAWDSVKNIFSNSWEGIKSVAGTLLGGILNLFENSVSGMISIGADIIGGLIEGLKSKTDAVKNTVISMISGFTDSIKSFFGISSPSKLMKQYFSWVGEGMIIGLNSQADELVKTSKKISENVTDSLHIDPTGLITSSKDVLDNMQEAIPDLKSNINRVVNIKTEQSNAKPPEILITGNSFVIREESDIEKVAKEVLRQLTKETQYNSRIGGIALI